MSIWDYLGTISSYLDDMERCWGENGDSNLWCTEEGNWEGLKIYTSVFRAAWRDQCEKEEIEEEFDSYIYSLDVFLIFKQRDYKHDCLDIDDDFVGL